MSDETPPNLVVHRFGTTPGPAGHVDQEHAIAMLERAVERILAGEVHAIGVVISCADESETFAYAGHPARLLGVAALLQADMAGAALAEGRTS